MGGHVRSVEVAWGQIRLHEVRLHIWSWSWLRSLEVTRGHTVWLWGYLGFQEDTVPVHRITGGQLRSHEVSLLRSHELFFYCKLISTAIRIRTFKSYSSTQIFLTNYKDLNECRLCTVYIRNNFFFILYRYSCEIKVLKWCKQIQFYKYYLYCEIYSP